MALLTRCLRPLTGWGARSGDRAAPRRLSGRGVAALVTLLAWTLAFPQAQTAERGLEAEEYQLKAIFLCKFASFVQWPVAALPESSPAVIVGVLGQDPFGEVLDETARKQQLNGKRFIVKRSEAVADLADAHVLFISSSKRDELQSILESLRGSRVLTVGEMEHFAERGGMIELSVTDERVRFAINRAAAIQSGLNISSRLLNLATRIVEQDPRREAGP